jgi:hypothetical protein
MAMGGDDLPLTINYNADVTKHVHLSMPWLGRFADENPVVDEAKPAYDVPHAAAAVAVVESKYAGLLSIEMRNNEDASIDWVEKAIDFCQATYAEALKQPAAK